MPQPRTPVLRELTMRRHSHAASVWSSTARQPRALHAAREPLPQHACFSACTFGASRGRALRADDPAIVEPHRCAALASPGSGGRPAPSCRRVSETAVLERVDAGFNRVTNRLGVQHVRGDRPPSAVRNVDDAAHSRPDHSGFSGVRVGRHHAPAPITFTKSAARIAHRLGRPPRLLGAVGDQSAEPAVAMVVVIGMPDVMMRGPATCSAATHPGQRRVTTRDHRNRGPWWTPPRSASLALASARSASCASLRPAASRSRYRFRPGAEAQVLVRVDKARQECPLAAVGDLSRRGAGRHAAHPDDAAALDTDGARQRLATGTVDDSVGQDGGYGFHVSERGSAPLWLRRARPRVPGARGPRLACLIGSGSARTSPS